MKTRWFSWSLVLPLALLSLPLATAQNPYLGEIRFVAFNFAPTGWATCDGQILPINEYTALFSLLGTTYGGNGTSTFALPNLESRIPVGMGQGVGLSPRPIGQMGGAEQIFLTPMNSTGFLGEVWGSRNFVQSTMPPYLALNCIIALTGIFPSPDALRPPPENSEQVVPAVKSRDRHTREDREVSDPRLATLLIETVKSLHAELQSQRAEIQQLKREIRQLKSSSTVQ